MGAGPVLWADLAVPGPSWGSNLVFFVYISAVLAIVGEKKHTKRQGDERLPRVFVVSCV